MPTRPYTQRLILAAGVNAGFTVPTGYRAVAVSLLCYQGAAASGGVALFIASSPVVQLVPGQYKSLSLAMRLAAYAGETFVCQVLSADSVAALTGYLFEDLTGPVADQHDVADLTPLPA